MRLNMFFVLDIKHENSMMMYVFNLKTHLLAFISFYITRKRKKIVIITAIIIPHEKFSQKVTCVIRSAIFWK